MSNLCLAPDTGDESDRIRTFRCFGCGRLFSTSTPLHVREEEFVKRYGHPSTQSEGELVSVCDECDEIITNRSRSK